MSKVNAGNAKGWPLWLAGLAATLLALGGCDGGGDGAAGAPGASGAPGAAGATGAPGATGPALGIQVADLHGSANADEATRGPNSAANPWTTITAATVDASGKLVVDFKVSTDAAGKTPYTVALPAAALRFSIAQLRPGDKEGDSSYWVNYVNAAKARTTTVDPATNRPYGTTPAAYKMNQPSQEAATVGTLSSTGTGSYRYVSAVVLSGGIDIAANNSDVALLPNGGKYAYNAALTHRVAIQMSDPDGTGPATMGANNASFDFVPDGKTAKLSREIVNIANCNDGCHKTLGMHGGGRLDYKLCVTCHNPTNGDPESGNILDLKVMVHKIHSGKYLPSVNYDFAGNLNGLYKSNPDGAIKGTPYKIWGFNNAVLDASDILIPANPANCTVCHKNAADADNYKTKPTKEACGSCHDGIDFATGKGRRMWFPNSKISMAAGVGGAEVKRTDSAAFAAQIDAGHKGGAVANAACALCHTASGSQASPDAIPAPVPAVHGDFSNGWSKMKSDYNIDLSMSAPANGTHYVAGEKPIVTLVLKDATTGVSIDHSKISDDAPSDFGPGTNTGSLYGLYTDSGTPVVRAPKGVSVTGTLTLYVSGPRALRKPVLTTVALNPTFASLTGALYGNASNDLRKRTGTNAPLQDDVGATKLTGVISRVDPGKLQYQLAAVPTGMTPGTYVAMVQATKKSSAGVDPKSMSLALTTFKVGQAAEEARVAYGCPDCHSTTVWHDNVSNGANGNHPAKFDPDYCGNCHDYAAQQVAYSTGGTSYKVSADSAGNKVFTAVTLAAGSGQAWKTGGNNQGFSAAPIARRVHGVHNGGTKRADGSYMLNYPYEVYNGENVTIGFPMDVRNCEKCHNSSTSGSWKTKPSRVACLACHDSDAAYAHATLQTLNPAPAVATAAAGTTTPTSGPYSDNAIESCPVCHASR